MSRRTLLRLYPRRWRDRYGDEFLALLEQQPVTPAVILDVLFGALDAHLWAHRSPVAETAGERMMQRLRALRATALTVFCAYVTFVVAGLALLGMVDDSPFIPAMREHFALNACWLVVEAGAAVALLAAVVGGLPIGFATFGYARSHKRRDILRLLCVPVIALGVQLVAVALLIAISFGRIPFPFPVGNTAAGEPPRIGNVVLTAANATLFVAGAIASTAAVAIAVARSAIGARRVHLRGVRIVVQPYRFALLPAAITALAMAVTLAGTLCWGVVARHVAPHAVTTGTLLTWLAIVGAMALATLVAAIGVIHGYAGHAAPASKHR